MNLLDLAYAPLRTPEADFRAMTAEVLRYKSEMNTSPVAVRFFDEQFLGSLPRLASPESYDKVARWDNDAKQMVKRSKDAKVTFHALNFTTSATWKSDPGKAGLAVRNQMKHHSWHWNERFELPKTRAFITDLLQPREVMLCRALVCEREKFVPFHVDRGNDDEREKGFVHVNFVLQSGGAPLVMQIGAELVEIRDRAFLFKDSHVHGVPVVSDEDRVVLSFAGAVDLDRVASLVDWERAKKELPAAAY
jgi:hypothetical protein